MVDVNTLIVPASDLSVVDAFEINERGEITAHGFLPNGDTHAVLLIPCDEGHSHLEGCDYEAVEEVADAQVRSAPITPSAAAASAAKLSPAERMARFRSLMATRNRRFGAASTKWFQQWCETDVGAEMGERNARHTNWVNRTRRQVRSAATAPHLKSHGGNCAATQPFAECTHPYRRCGELLFPDLRSPSPTRHIGLSKHAKPYPYVTDYDE